MDASRRQIREQGRCGRKNWFGAAVAKDEALAQADAGNYREASEKLKSQADLLNSNWQYAAPEVQIQIRGEADNLYSGAASWNKGNTISPRASRCNPSRGRCEIQNELGYARRLAIFP